jgi:hypothetical protein
MTVKVHTRLHSSQARGVVQISIGDAVYFELQRIFTHRILYKANLFHVGVRFGFIYSDDRLLFMFPHVKIPTQRNGNYIINRTKAVLPGCLAPLSFRRAPMVRMTDD